METKKVLLKLEFDVGRVESICMLLLSTEKWNRVKKYLSKKHCHSSIDVYVGGAPFPVEENISFKNILRNVEEIYDLDDIKAFRQLFGESFSSSANPLDAFF